METDSVLIYQFRHVIKDTKENLPTSTYLLKVNIRN